VERQSNEEGDFVEKTDEISETEIKDPDTGETVRGFEETQTTRGIDMPGEQIPEELKDIRQRLAGEPPLAARDDGGRNRRNTVSVRLGRTSVMATPDAPLWWAIEESTKRLSFNNYFAFMDYVLCGGDLPREAVPVGEDAAIVAELVSLRDRVQNKNRTLKERRFLPFTDTDAYRLLKVATEAFVSVNCAVLPFYGDGEGKRERRWWDRADLVEVFDGKDITADLDRIREAWYRDYLRQVNGTNALVLPYLAIIRRKLSDANIKSAIFRDDDGRGKARQHEERCYGIIRDKLISPCLIELIWSYWHEQGMLVQTMNAISRRFQNIHGPADQDPLSMMELDPLRPLNNLLWGYIQDEQHRLTLLRRAYEYDHHYGLTLEGKAVPPLRTADSRSKFLDSFHNLLYLCSVFHKQDDDTTVVSDAFPILIALRDLHMQLVEGAHNQFGDLPSTARVEMLMQEWLLARPEFREILPTRIMVDYPEPWMDRVDAMKRLQGWPGANVMHFRDLGRYGEQILLTIRFGNWNEAERDQAKVWARYWRSQAQSYIHAYRIVTGVDLTADVTQPQQRSLITTQPAVLLRTPLPGAAQAAPQLPPPSAPSGARFRERRAARNS